MVATVHFIDMLEFPDTTKVAQIKSTQYDPGIRSILLSGANNVHPLFRAHQVQQPVIRLACSQLATLIGQVGLFGTAYTSAVNTYMRKGSAAGPINRATTTHQRCAATFCYVHIERVTLEDNGEGTADVVITVGYNGSVEPLVFTGSLALPGNLTHDEVFGVGPCYINNTLVSSIKRAVIEPGVTLIVESSDSVGWPTYIAIQRTEPVITIESTEVTPATGAGVDGIALDGSNGIVVYGRKLTKNHAGNVMRVNNATEEHLKFTGLYGTYWWSDLSGDDSSIINTSIRAELVSPNDSSVPMTVSTGSAIP